MNSAGIFPKWIDPFDTWHLRLLPPILIVLVLALLALPKPSKSPTQSVSSADLVTSVSPPTQNPVPLSSARPSPTPGTAPAAPPQAVAVMRPSRIESPSPNALFWRDRLGDVEGAAEPGSLVRLFLGDKLLSQTTAAPDGRFRFRLLDFPAGSHTVRVIATLGRAAQSSEPVSFVVKSEKPSPPAATPSPRRIQALQMPLPNPPSPRKTSKPTSNKQTQDPR